MKRSYGEVRARYSSHTDDVVAEQGSLDAQGAIKTLCLFSKQDKLSVDRLPPPRGSIDATDSTSRAGKARVRLPLDVASLAFLSKNVSDFRS